MKKNILKNSALVLTAAVAITACKKPEATFTASTATPMVGEYVIFADGHDDKTIKKADITYDFGDGSQINGVASPSHAYYQAGVYKVTQQVVKAKNSEKNGKMAVLTTDITVSAAAAAFDASKTAAYEGEPISFTNKTDETKGSSVSYQWMVYNEVGQVVDGSSDKNFVWTANNNGKFKVVLWAFQGGSKTSKDAEITVTGFNSNSTLAAFLNGDFNYSVAVAQTFAVGQRSPAGLEIYSSIVLRDGNSQTSKLKLNNWSNNGLGNPSFNISVQNNTLVSVNSSDGLWDDPASATAFGVSLNTGNYVASLSGNVLTLTNTAYDNAGVVTKTCTITLTKK